MLKQILAAATLFLAASPATATPVLRAEVTVVAGIVTVGDMFDNSGELAERGIFRAPLPGTTGVVTLEQVRAAAEMIGLTRFEADGLSRITVARAATVVDTSVLTGFIVDDLRARGIVGDGVMVETSFADPHLRFNAEAVDTPVVLLGVSFAESSGSFSARFSIAGEAEPVDVAGRVVLSVAVPHLVGGQPAGAMLTAADIELRPVPLRLAGGSRGLRLEDIVGKALVRHSRSGLMLKPSDLTEPVVVSRNALVTVYLRTGAMTLTVKGQALSAAAAGEPVQVLNPVSKKILHGVAMPNGSVEISSVLNVAGL